MWNTEHVCLDVYVLHINVQTLVNKTCFKDCSCHRYRDSGGLRKVWRKSRVEMKIHEKKFKTKNGCAEDEIVVVLHILLVFFSRYVHFIWLVGLGLQCECLISASNLFFLLSCWGKFQWNTSACYAAKFRPSQQVHRPYQNRSRIRV